LGSIYLGYAVLFWLARNSPNSETRRAIVVSAFVAMVLGLILSIYDRVVGIENALAWSTVVIFLLLSIGYGYFAFIKPNAD
jgi:apolipoprotein N-acyltransferase